MKAAGALRGLPRELRRTISAIYWLAAIFLANPDRAHFAAAQYFKLMKVWTLVELLFCFKCSRCNFEFAHCGDGAISMTMEFIDGIILAMLPSMFTVAWLVWRADPQQGLDY